MIRTLCHRAHKICSRELFAKEINKIKLILNKNGSPQELINKIFNLQLKILNKLKPVGSEKCLITLLLPYVNKKSRIIERNTNQSISKTYHSAKLKVIFLSKPMIRPGGKHPISEYKKYGSLPV